MESKIYSNFIRNWETEIVEKMPSREKPTASKVSVFGVIRVRIFPHSD